VSESLFRSKRALAVAVVATVVGVSAAVLLTGQTTTAHAAAAPGSTVRASVSSEGNQSGGANQELSADGTTVAFASYSQLDPLTNERNEAVYVRDLRANRTVMISRGQLVRPVPPDPTPTPTPTPTTTTTTSPTFTGPKLAGRQLVSLNGRRVQPPPAPEMREVAPNGGSSDPTISEDGRYVAFTTQADNILLEDDDTDQDLLVCDRDPDGDGVFDEERETGGLDYRYFRANVPQWTQGDGYRFRSDYPKHPKLSDDASRLVWEDEFSDDNGTYHQVVRTSSLTPPTGVVVGPGPVEIVSTPLGAGTDLVSQLSPDVSSDGRFVVLAADYVRREGPVEFPDRIPFHAIVRADMVDGTVTRVDWDEATTPEEPVYLSVDESVYLATPAISGDGATVAFTAEAYQDNCSEGSCWYSVSEQPTVYVVRIGDEGEPISSAITSRDNDGEIVNGVYPALSGDGRFLAFATDNDNAHDGIDTPVYYYDNTCITGRNSDFRGRPLVNLAGLPPVSDERNRRFICQVVVRDLVVDGQRRAAEERRLPGTLASPGTGRDCAAPMPDNATCAGNDDSPPDRTTAPSLSRNGSTVAYDSGATDLVPDVADGNEQPDVFVRTFRPALRADPTPLEFGEVTLDETLDEVVRFGHTGFGPLAVTEVVVDGSDEFTVGAQTCVGPEDGGTVVLQQAGSCEVSVTFAPKTEGEHTATLIVRVRDGREFTVPLVGTGVEEELPPPDAGRFEAGPSPLAFGERLLLSDAPSKTVTVTNTGGTALTVTGVSVVSPLAPTDYTIASNTCADAPVAPAGTCQVTVKFSPKASGARTAVLRFTDDVPDDTAHLVSLTGSAGVPVLQVSPGVSQPGRTITVTGTGYAPGKQVTIRITGSVETATAVPDATGTFSRILLIMSKSPIGTHPVTGTIDGTEPPISAARPVLIVSPSVSPADFVIRN
jgi:hypothetical protein